MRRKSQVEILNQPGMARARALIKAVGYDSEDLRPLWRGSICLPSWCRAD